MNLTDVAIIALSGVAALVLIQVGAELLGRLFDLVDRIHPLAWLPLAEALLFLPFILDHHFGIGV